MFVVFLAVFFEQHNLKVVRFGVSTMQTNFWRGIIKLILFHKIACLSIGHLAIKFYWPINSCSSRNSEPVIFGTHPVLQNLRKHHKFWSDNAMMN